MKRSYKYQNFRAPRIGRDALTGARILLLAATQLYLPEAIFSRTTEGDPMGQMINRLLELGHKNPQGKIEVVAGDSRAGGNYQATKDLIAAMQEVKAMTLGIGPEINSGKVMAIAAGAKGQRILVRGSSIGVHLGTPDTTNPPTEEQLQKIYGDVLRLYSDLTTASADEAKRVLLDTGHALTRYTAEEAVQMGIADKVIILE